MKKVYVILLAGGTGSRMGAGVNKVLLPVAGVPCIARSARALAAFAQGMVVVHHPGEEAALEAALRTVFPQKISASLIPGGEKQLKAEQITSSEEKSAIFFHGAQAPLDSGRMASSENAIVSFVPGGETRQDSVRQGVLAIREIMGDEDAQVLIHDGARCLVSGEVISGVLSSLRERGSGVAAIPVTDTLRPSEAGQPAGQVVPREGLYAMQTPQGFRLKDLLSAFEKADEDSFQGTDDAALMAHAGFPVFLTPGSRNNLKITTPEDLKMAEALLREENLPNGQNQSSQNSSQEIFPSLRVGHGYDVHQLVEGRRLILCGVEIPHDRGLLGHSDADVALHALMDALLGAAGLGDIGRHFPDSDPRYKGIDSRKLLVQVVEKLQAAGFRPANADVTIVAQRPKLASYIPRMAENVAADLGLPLGRVNVKATTTERLGFEGRMEGISAQAVCMIMEMK